MCRERLYLKSREESVQSQSPWTHSTRETHVRKTMELNVRSLKFRPTLSQLNDFGHLPIFSGLYYSYIYSENKKIKWSPNSLLIHPLRF